MNTPLRLLLPLRAALLFTLLAAPLARLGAQTPPPPANRLPPAGIAISAAERAELTAGVATLRHEIDVVAREVAAKPALLVLLPDVEIFHKAVDWALRYDEFFDAKQVATARILLAAGRERARQLTAGTAKWLEGTGVTLRGYRSRLDGSIQPYVLVVPGGWTVEDTAPRRLDVVLAGRNEKRTELAFLAEHMPELAGPDKAAGDLVPPDTFILHPYGRYCNATKFAGEADVFEAMGAVRAGYPIHPDRIVVRGFSMGGASTWHLATHHAGTWVAASPGAGFAETAVYTKALDPGKEPRTWWEQRLWRWYDATAYAGNLFNSPTIAYSGELDPQKQAADIMEDAMRAEGLKLVRLIGTGTAHQYHPGSLKDLGVLLEALVSRGRPAVPREVHLVTYTLQYPRNSWVTVTGLEKHWERADVRARFERAGQMTINTKNVTSLELTGTPGWQGTITIDSQRLVIREQSQLGSIPLTRIDGGWTASRLVTSQHKTTGVTGPIDDAFMDSFLFVRPTGKPLNAKVGAWANAELAQATKLWRDIFRGEVQVKDDAAIKPGDIAASNLILWGDPSSNEVLAQILDRLPIKWDAKTLTFAGRTYDAAHHAPVLIFPNPLNPARYVVLNSGMDLRDEAYGTNALQTPKLPDYAIVDLDTPPGPRWPGKIVEAGFFNEDWK